MRLKKNALYAIYDDKCETLVACVEAKNKTELEFLIKMYEQKTKKKITSADSVPTIDLVMRDK